MTYQIPIFARLEPRTPWTGGRVTETDVLTLADAASMATSHARQAVTTGDILRAAGRGEIPLMAIVNRAAKTQPCRDGDMYLTVPNGSIQALPLEACKALANVGRASWRSFEWFESVEAFKGTICRFKRWQLTDDEPDLETTQDDCRVTGRDIHALADEFLLIDETNTAPHAAQAQQADTVTAPVVEAPAWENLAQVRAWEIIKHDGKRDLYPPQTNIADKIANEFRNATPQIVGAGGKPLTGAYIKRHALRGISSEQGKQLSITLRRGK